MTSGVNLYVSNAGSDAADGTLDRPFATLERAQTAVRSVLAGGQVPSGGVNVWLRAGTYERTTTFELTSEDSGSQAVPVRYSAYPGEVARITGARKLEPQWFEPVTSSSPVWNRVDPLARGQVQQVPLASHGINDFGALTVRGFGPGGTAALELFFDNQPMELARWPDPEEDSPPITAADDVVQVFGSTQPDVSGTFVKAGVQDGVNAYARQGLVNGLQYFLYRYSFPPHQAWFLTTQTNGYPGNPNPWWYRYTPDLGNMDPANGAAGQAMFLDPAAIHHGFVTTHRALSGNQFSYGGDRPARWTHAPEPWLHGYWKYMWAEFHVPLLSLDTNARTMEIPPPPFGLGAGQPFYAENLLEELTRPGEWYLERSTGILYFWPPAPLDGADITVSIFAGPLVRLTNTQHITFSNLILEGTRTTLMDISGGDHNRVEQSTLRNAGTTAVTVTGSFNSVDHCTIHGTGDGGIRMQGGVRASLTPSNNTANHNTIHGFSRWSWTYTPAVSVNGVGHQVAHNHIYNAPHTAILFGGNNMLLELNHIHDVCRFTSDAGAIYGGRDWGYRGTRIRHNFIHHLSSAFEGYGVHAVYLDDCISGIEVTGNTFYRVQNAAIQHGGGRDVIMTNNVAALCGSALQADNRGIVMIDNTPGSDWNFLERLARDGVMYQQEPWASAYPALAAIPNDWAAITASGATWREPEDSVFSRNVGYQNTLWLNAAAGVFTTFADVSDNLTGVDPQFVDEATLNLALQPSSPAFALPGWESIPFEQVGPQP